MENPNIPFVPSLVGKFLVMFLTGGGSIDHAPTGSFPKSSLLKNYRGNPL